MIGSKVSQAYDKKFCLSFNHYVCLKQSERNDNMGIEYVIISISFIIFAIISIIVIKLIRKKEDKEIKSSINRLEVKKNKLDSMPVMVELAKIEDIAKSEQLEEKISEFKLRYQEVKEVKLTKINDMITDLDVSFKRVDVKEFVIKESNIELELDEAESSLNNIMSEIDEIASYEEKYRNIVLKLKAKYRFLEHSYTEKEPLLGDLKDAVKMQFENIAKRFSDFDKVMDEKLYNEVVLVVKSIDTMIDNLDVILLELPDILLLLNDLIPGRIEDLKKEYQKMEEEGYNLGFLNLEKNFEDIDKKKNDILTRAKVLNITDSLFDLRTVLEYLDGLFKDLEEEKDEKSKFDNLDEAFNTREKKLDVIVKDIYNQLDDIKSLYHLTEKDLETIYELNLKFSSIVKEYKKFKREIKKNSNSYKKNNITLNELLFKINAVSQEFDNALRELGSFYDDEMRAREELKNMNNLLNKCKKMIRGYNLPIVHNNYFVQEEEAEDAINEVAKELDNKPIVIKNLNMRVDTARDLTFKLYSNTNDMIKYAYFSELLIVYGNKFRIKKDIEKGLSKAEMLYYRGNYHECFDCLLKLISSLDNELFLKINKLMKD